MKARKKILVNGIVQAVGFRPFIYNLARRLKLSGFVKNTGAGVYIEAQGSPAALTKFIEHIKQNPPSLSRVESVKINAIPPKKDAAFEIKTSAAQKASTSIPADIAVCKNCQKDIADKNNRRYRYPFTNCTDCGPRYTIIKSLPYDRAKTTMASFKMCPACRAEFEDPVDRRFHAQPNCCPVCGPQVSFIYKNKNAGGVEEACAKLKRGGIIAVKSLGGFHLACDALNKKTVALLRKRKNRPHKPLALMFGNIKAIKEYCHVNKAEEELLKSKEAPVVMLKKRKNIPLISEGLATTGVMLPYTPLHKVIFDILGPQPLVMTSGNISGQPICIENEEAMEKLAHAADGFLLHDRPIHNRMDDSVLFELNGKTHFLRRARGYAPGYIKLPSPLKKEALALGANLTNTFCLGKGDKLFLSQYIGDLDNTANINYFKDTLAKMQKLLNIKPKIFVRDLHPQYFGSIYKPSAKPVQHHLAHALAAAAEHNIKEKFLCFAFDGTGLGADNTIWGGEFLVIDKNKWRRAGCFEPVKITGGESAAADIWKCALSYMLAAGIDAKKIKKVLDKAPAADIETAVKAAQNNINCYTYSGLGRLFDAAAAILGLRMSITYQAQGAMELEGLCRRKTKKIYPFKIENIDGLLKVNTKGIIEGLINAQNAEEAADIFHNTLAAIICAAAAQIKIKTIVLAGGVFQNKVLLAAAVSRLEAKGFKVYTNNAVPSGDGAVALGQLYACYRSFV